MSAGTDRMIGRIAVTDYRGPGASPEPVLVFLHGLAFSRRTWVGACNDLSESFPCLALDVPGHGGSPRSERFLTIPDMADEVATALRADDLSDVVLVGNSMGATVAVALADQHPDLVAKLVLVGPAVWAGEADRRAWLHSRSGLFFEPDKTLKRPAPEFVTQLFGAFDEDRHQLILAEQRDAAASIESAVWALYSYDIAYGLSVVDQPMLAVFGGNDPYLNLSMPVIRKQVGRLDEAVVDGGSHVLPIDKPAELAACIRDWVATELSEQTEDQRWT